MKRLGRSIAALASITLVLSACEMRETQPDAAPANGVAANEAAANTSAAAGVPLTQRATDAALQWSACPALFPKGCEIAVLHGDPAKPNADIFLRVPGGYAIPPHSHTSAERIILVGGQLEVKYRGAPRTTLDVGNYAYGPAGLPHEAVCRSSEPCILFVAFEEPVDAKPVEGALG
jgi:quercetin dioxygenase-like cupin family protein